ncbi:ralBP1-associated Eps domain-containing protein 1 isoform X2 [Armigeres subalbatus]
MNLPLPQFSWIDSPTGLPPSIGGASSTDIINSSSAMTERNGYKEVKNSRDLIELTAASSGSSRERVDAASNSGDMTNSDQPSTDSEVEPNDDSMLRSAERHHAGGGAKSHGGSKTSRGAVGGNSSGVGGSPEAWSTASDSPTPTNSVAERPWANQNLWQGLVCEEQRQLLGTEEESSDRHSSDEDQEVDLEYFYQISQTQKEYYLKQFRTIQPDVHGLVSGQVARVFFEKSRIPIEELRHIWQMCDVTRDGALNLAEFTAAMHLVVLRRNNIPVPATLPPCLMPTLLQNSLFTGSGGSGALQNQLSGGSAGGVSTGSTTGTDKDRTDPEEADLLHLESDDNTDSQSRANPEAKDYQRIISHPEPLKLAHQSSSNNTTLVSVGGTDSPPTVTSTTGSSKIINMASGRKTPTSLVSPPNNQPKQKPSNELPATPPNALSNNKDWNSASKEWTKFTESPTSNVSSPGPKPVNFDMQRTTQAIVSDPQILHPVPLRVTPVGAEAADNSNLVFSDVTVGSGGILIVQRDDSSPKQLQAQIVQQLPQPVAHPNQRDSLTSSDLRAIQRPQPKKPPSKGVGAIPPPPQREPSVTSSSGGTAAGVDSMATSLDTATFNSVINSTAGHTVVVSTVANSASKKDQPPPPLPPPRPSQHRHTRSSSLDLNKLKMNNATKQQIEDQMRMPPPPEVPPRVTPTAEHPAAPGFADFAHFPNAPSADERKVSAEGNVTTIHLDASGNMTTAPPQHTTPRGSLSSSWFIVSGPSAFEVYRKPQQQSHSRGSESPPQPPPLVASRSVESSSLDYEKRISALSDNLRQVRFKNSEVTNGPDVLKHLKEQNLLLLRICSDLSEELLQIQQKREDIRIKIELQEQNLGASSIANSGQQQQTANGGAASSVNHLT